MWLHLHRADSLFPWWEGLTRELLSAPGHTEHPKRLPCSGFSISSSHTGPLPGKAMGGKLCQQVMAAQRSSNLTHPGISSLLRELAAISQEGSYEDGLWFIFASWWGSFPETEKSSDPRVLLRQLGFDSIPVQTLPGCVLCQNGIPCEPGASFAWQASC